MKKNLMNAALLGLLVVAAPACTFVSCKDYDDDFNKVNNRLDGLDAAKTQVNTEITNLKSSLAETNKKITDLSTKLGDYATKAELNAAVENLNTKIAAAAALETRIKVLEDAKTSLETLVAGKVDQSAFNSKVAEIERKLESASSAATKAISALSTKDEVSKVDKAVQDLKTKVDNQKTTYDAYEARIKALENAGSSNGSADQIEALKKTVTDALSPLRNDLKKLQDANYQTEEQVKAAIKTASDDLEKKIPSAANMLLTDGVTSIVYRPSAVFDFGQGVLESEYLYNLYSGVEAVGDNGVVAFTKDAVSSDDLENLRYGVASFEVNPSLAKVSTDVKDYSFSTLESVYRTTRATEEKPAVEVRNVSVDGSVLNVVFKSNLSDRNAAKKGLVNLVSLGYTEKNEAAKTSRLVRSEYLRLVQETNRFLVIGKVDTKVSSKASLLAEDRFANPKKNDLEFEVAHDGSAFSVAENVATYTTRDEQAAIWANVDANAAAASELKKAGFKYEFALVKADSKDAAGKVVEDKSTEAFTINKTTGELKAVVDSKNPYKNIGKSATVRVTLSDENGKVVSVGYFTAKISLKAVVVATLKSDDKLPYTCDGSNIGDVKFKLDELNQYLADTYKEEWKVWKANHHYKFEVAKDNKQYRIKDGVATEVVSPKGTINVDYQKEVLTLSGLTQTDVKDSLSKGGTTYSTIVKVTKENDPLHVFYVRLLWTPNVQPAPTVAFSGKPIANDWKENQNVPGEVEQRLHVTFDANVSFVNNVVNGVGGGTQQYFQVGTVKEPTISSDYLPEIKNGLKTSWEFVKPNDSIAVGANGLKYLLTPAVDGRALFAQPLDKNGKLTGNKTSVAKITADGTITYQENYVAKTLLNYADAKSLKYGQTLTGRVAYVSRVCGKRIAVTGENAKYAEFDVKFLRPLSVTYTGEVQFVDAQGTSQVQTAEIKFTNAWEDWRAEKGDALKSLYKVTKVGFAPAEKWTTDLNGGNLETQLLLPAFSNRGLSFGSEVQGQQVTSGDFNGYTEYNLGTYPKMHYKTQTGNFTTFKVKIPIYVKYAWGELKSSITVTVSSTKNQPNARRK